jgi:hypothetical protein
MTRMEKEKEGQTGIHAKDRSEPLEPNRETASKPIGEQFRGEI